MQRLILNSDSCGNARRLKAGYYKFAWTNFLRELEGKEDGFRATAIVEIYESDD